MEAGAGREAQPNKVKSTIAAESGEQEAEAARAASKRFAQPSRAPQAKMTHFFLSFY